MKMPLKCHLSQLMWKGYLSHKRTVKAQARRHIDTVSPEPSLLTHTIQGNGGSFIQRTRDLVPLDSCKCAFERTQMSRLMTKPTKWLCTQQRLRSAWASVQSDQSSLCTQWIDKDPSLLHVDSEDSDQPGHAQADLSLHWAHSHFVVSVMRWLKSHDTRVLFLINRLISPVNLESF